MKYIHVVGTEIEFQPLDAVQAIESRTDVLLFGSAVHLRHMKAPSLGHLAIANPIVLYGQGAGDSPSATRLLRRYAMLSASLRPRGA